MMSKLNERIEQLERDNDRLRGVIGLYANEKNWNCLRCATQSESHTRKHEFSIFDGPSVDGFDIAKAALALRGDA